MRLNSFYRKDVIFDNSSRSAHLVAYGLIVSIVNLLLIVYGDLFIQHARALSAVNIFPSKEEHALSFALTGKGKMEITSGETDSSAAKFFVQDQTLHYYFADNPVIKSVTWRVEELGHSNYPLLQWRCEVNYFNKQPLWLLKNFNGNYLLCK